MSAAITVGALGVGFSIFSGISSGNQAKRERALEQQELQQNQQIGDELKAEEAPYQAIVKQQTGELSSKALTPEAQMAQDALKARMGGISRNINEQAPLTGQGVAGGRQLSTQFAQAQGLAGIGLEDAVNKRSALGGWVNKGLEEPAWARVKSGANQAMAGAAGQWAAQDQAESKSAYGQAASGLANLAKLYNAPTASAQPAPDGGGGVGGASPDAPRAISNDTGWNYDPGTTSLQGMQRQDPFNPVVNPAWGQAANNN